ncbi:zinc transporter ZIP1 [Trichonephila inaurata madagascariensis]|uniref:Zinc transporter ZIP1 n=1 Tax=Trichonephila inaurata madagascariensis TaxID=2747483 RepID=A0A8X6WR20_9ARAC|nr:zinc transporter ZIP1 [Trichonephila inaurata madagascariensis]
MNDLLISRLICMFLLLLGTLFFGILPVYVKKNLFKCDCNSDTCKTSCKARKGKLITSFLIYFGGGVLLGTTFLHLLPESREAFEEPHDVKPPSNSTGGDDDHHESFPIPEFIVCCGFFAVYLFEEIVHFFFGGHTHVPSENKALRSFSTTSGCSSAPMCVEGGLTSSGKHKPSASDVQHVIQSSEGLVQHDSHHEASSFSLTGLLTVAALSFHSLFEGFAIGLRPDAMSTWIVFAAVSVHKFVIAFVVGLEVLATGGKNTHVYSYMSVFSLMSPLGMAIAMFTQSNLEESNPLTVSVLNAIATGTLLYVTFFEILQREEHKDIATWQQLMATSLGFIILCAIQYGSTFA